MHCIYLFENRVKLNKLEIKQASNPSVAPYPKFHTIPLTVVQWSILPQNTPRHFDITFESPVQPKRVSDRTPQRSPHNFFHPSSIRSSRKITFIKFMGYDTPDGHFCIHIFPGRLSYTPHKFVRG